MTELSPELRELAEACGVATDYWDWRGRHVPVRPGDRRPGAGRAGRRRRHPGGGRRGAGRPAPRAAGARMLPPCVVTREGRAPGFEVHVAAR